MRVLESRKTPFRWWRLNDVADERSILDAYASVPTSDWPRWVRYSNEIENAKRTTREVKLSFPIDHLSGHLAGSEVKRHLSAISGVSPLLNDPELYGAGLHVIDPGGWLQVHGDYELHPCLEGYERRLNLILWLNPTWEPEWGGSLLLCDGMGKRIKSFLPTPGEAILFEGGPIAFHGTEQTADDAPPRVTMAMYYLARARPSATRLRALFMPNRESPKCPVEVRMADA